MDSTIPGGKRKHDEAQKKPLIEELKQEPESPSPSKKKRKLEAEGGEASENNESGVKRKVKTEVVETPTTDFGELSLGKEKKFSFLLLPN